MESERLRRAHPYHMYEAIRQQPERIARLLASQRENIVHTAAAIARHERILSVGTGTSLHAALAGERFLRHWSGGRAWVRVEESFELVHAPLALGSADAVLLTSHRGGPGYSVEALERAKASGAFTVAITGAGGGNGLRGADAVITTCEQEISMAHTKSYTTALAAHALLAAEVARHRGWSPGSAAERDVEQLPELVEGSLATEADARAVAGWLGQLDRLFFLGAGLQSITAREAALKVKETSYIHAEGFSSEEFLHGPLAACDERAAVVAFLDAASAARRTVQALRAARETGARGLAVVSSGVSVDARTAPVLVVPAAPDWLALFPHTVAAQWLAYFLALERGTNPDTGREEQPAHARARQQAQP
ncbi:MAG: SIS domain-containing protein [Acidobacteriia bacterium]|jgi:glucosamine--fructose-6-phosphate aminotransferase (isomerizing)|nr:SIS domain-containing protein [Terriglobia bacterium]